MQTAGSLLPFGSLLPCGMLYIILLSSGVIADIPGETRDGTPQCQEGSENEAADAMSLMQGANVRLDLLGRSDVERSPKHSAEHAKLAQVNDVEDVSLFSGAPIVAAKAGRQAAVSSTRAKATAGMSLLLVHLGTKIGVSMGVSMMLFLVLVLACLLVCCTAAISPLVAQKDPSNSRSRTEGRPEGAVAERQSVMQSLVPSRDSPVVAQLPQGSPASSWPLPPYPFGRGGMRPSTSAFSDGIMAPSPTSGGPLSEFVVPHAPQPLVHTGAACGSAPPAPFSTKAPPALCPTLVMPVCEARFGVPMNDLAQFGLEGMINIVGLSGNPLLRAGVRVDANRQRTLEICMPEKNSAPRARISPSLSTAGNYEISGVKGVFYGMLQLQTSGACYVIKDGQTVLMLDGDTEQLRLSVKSGAGSQLASVMVSAEPFGGVEHVEIRVEPGVDTVLVLAIVLGVLLLSDR